MAAKAAAGNAKDVKFRTVAEKQVSKLIKSIRRLGNLSDRKRYEYAPGQASQMFEALNDELHAAEQKFAPQAPQPKAAPTFMFK